MLFIFIVIIGGVLLYFNLPAPQVKEPEKKPQLIVRNTGKIFTQVDTSTYGRVPVQNKTRYEESETGSEELSTLQDIFGY